MPCRGAFYPLPMPSSREINRILLRPSYRTSHCRLIRQLYPPTSAHVYVRVFVVGIPSSSSPCSIRSSRRSTRIPPHRRNSSKESRDRLRGIRGPSTVVVVVAGVVGSTWAAAVVVGRRILLRCATLVLFYREFL